MPKTEEIVTTLRLPAWLHEDVRLHAARESRSWNAQVEHVLKNHVPHSEPASTPKPKRVKG